MDDFAAVALPADVKGVAAAGRGAELGLFDASPDFTPTVPTPELAGCRFVTTHPPMASSTANPPSIGQRYCCSASGASMGTPSPPPGRLSGERLSWRLFGPVFCDWPEG